MAHLPGGGNTTPPPPQRSTMLSLVDASGNLTPQGQQLSQQIQAVLANVAVSFPWIKWFQTVQQNLNSASDFAILASTIDENAGRAQLQAVLDAALAGVFGQANERPIVESVIPYLGDPQRPQQDMVSFESNQRFAEESIAAYLSQDNARFDFRAFTLQDTHANRGNYPPAAYPIGQAFWETDRRYLFVSDGTNWIYTGGMYVDVVANRPADLGTTDKGALFYATNTPALYWWDGAAWQGDIVNAPTGFRQANGATANHVLASDGTNFVDRALVNNDLPDSVAAHTITLLKLTGGGSNGSITWNAKGVITAFVDPT